MAALVMETVGTQEYQFEPEEFLGRIGKSYGPAVASDLGTHIGTPLPAAAQPDVADPTFTAAGDHGKPGYALAEVPRHDNAEAGR
jgi:hypothetical protein